MGVIKPVLLVHGGAGQIAGERIDACQAGCREAARIGWKMLCDGASALDAVAASVEALENNPEFNAGYGAVLNRLGEAQLDASLMDGETLAAGAVANVRRVRNPILLVRRVLEESRHVMLVGEGAESFAELAGMPMCRPADLIAERQSRRWNAAHGTVGCVALDSQGHLAAGTSTGGQFDAFPGRVGDSALIGSGTYANASAAVSCTGEGESIIRCALAHEACSLATRGDEPDKVAKRSVAGLETRVGGDAGLIMVDRFGRYGIARNTAHMPVCAVDGFGKETLFL